MSAAVAHSLESRHSPECDHFPAAGGARVHSVTAACAGPVPRTHGPCLAGGLETAALQCRPSNSPLRHTLSHSRVSLRR